MSINQQKNKDDSLYETFLDEMEKLGEVKTGKDGKRSLNLEQFHWFNKSLDFIRRFKLIGLLIVFLIYGYYCIEVGSGVANRLLQVLCSNMGVVTETTVPPVVTPIDDPEEGDSNNFEGDLVPDEWKLTSEEEMFAKGISSHYLDVPVQKFTVSEDFLLLIYVGIGSEGQYIYFYKILTDSSNLKSISIYVNDEEIKINKFGLLYNPPGTYNNKLSVLIKYFDKSHSFNYSYTKGD